MKSVRRICVFGAGAIGGHLAARLAAAGHEVSVIARGAQLEAIRRKGLVLRQQGRPDVGGPVRAAEQAADLGPQDAVFVTVKATALSSFAPHAAALAGPDTAFAFVQNGIPWWYGQGLGQRPLPPDLSRLDPGGALARAVEPRRVIGGVVYSSNEVIEPGVIEGFNPGAEHLVLGEPGDGESEGLLALRACLERSGLPSPAAQDIRAAVWDKLLNNMGACLCVLIDQSLRVFGEDPDMQALRDAIRQEGLAIAAAHGVDVGAAPRRPGGGQAPPPVDFKPSMLQDLLLGRPMEVEAQLRMPLAFARAAGVPAPHLRTLVTLVTRLAASRGLFQP